MWGKNGWGQLLALIAAVAVFNLYRNIRWGLAQARANHSPVDVRLVLSWLSVLPRRDLETETDTETETAPAAEKGPKFLGKKLGRRTVQVDENRFEVEHFEIDKDSLPLAVRATGRAESQLHQWIRRNLEENVPFSDSVRDGKSMFGKSRATIARAIKQVRERVAEEASQE